MKDLISQKPVGVRWEPFSLVVLGKYMITLVNKVTEVLVNLEYQARGVVQRATLLNPCGLMVPMARTYVLGFVLRGPQVLDPLLAATTAA